VKREELDMSARPDANHVRMMIAHPEADMNGTEQQMSISKVELMTPKQILAEGRRLTKTILALFSRGSL
jgi:hypothetical protein